MRIRKCSGSCGLRPESGAFAKSMQSLPKNVLAELASGKFKPLNVPTIPDGLVPPPRVEEKQHG